jgi:hypothetical protein
MTGGLAVPGLEETLGKFLNPSEGGSGGVPPQG